MSSNSDPRCPEDFLKEGEEDFYAPTWGVPDAERTYIAKVFWEPRAERHFSNHGLGIIELRIGNGYVEVSMLHTPERGRSKFSDRACRCGTRAGGAVGLKDHCILNTKLDLQAQEWSLRGIDRSG